MYHHLVHNKAHQAHSRRRYHIHQAEVPHQVPLQPHLVKLHPECATGYVLGELCYVPDDGTQVTVLTPDLEIMVTSIKDHRVEETTVRKCIVQEEQT